MTSGVSGGDALSVVIPCFNGAETLPLQLEALATQEGAGSFEVIVVDNRSTDDTAVVARKFASQGRLDLRVVSANELPGTSFARNVGIRHATSERIMFCDADDVVSQWWIALGAKAFDTCDLWSGSAIPLTHDEFTGDLKEIRRRFGDDPTWETPQRRAPKTFPVVFGGNFGATRSVLRSIGAFDQSFPAAGEDNDLGFRINRSGTPIVDALSVRIGYRGKSNTQTLAKACRAGAIAHTLLATRYDAWADSHMPRWYSEMARCLAAGLRMLIRPQRRDWVGLRVRWAIARGLAEGTIRYQYLRRLPEPMLGLGWFGAGGANGSAE